MIVNFHPIFKRQYKKLRARLQGQFKERLNIFLADPLHSLLHDHPLHGKYEGYRSINVTGDYRAVYKREDTDEILFSAIGTHDQLYR
jgi:addiction module RelE/StbE family toxin